MSENIFSQITLTILAQQHDWLNCESVRRALPKSAIVREALELLIKKQLEEKKK